jgi:hypothetical protein
MCFNHGYYILKFVACGIKEKKGVYLNHLLINVEVFRISSICTADVIAYCGKKINFQQVSCYGWQRPNKASG